MPKTKRTNDKKTTAISKIARKTVGLVVRVGDAVEAIAVAAAATPAPAARSKPPTSTAPALEAAPPGVLPAPTAARALAAPVIAVSQESREDERAGAAIDAYAALHNLRPGLMPTRATLVAALKHGMTEHGPSFTDAHAQLVLDAQMRSYFRSLGTPTPSPS